MPLRNFKVIKNKKQKVNINGIESNKETKLVSSDDGKHMGFINLFTWDKRNVEDKNIESLVSHVISGATWDACCNLQKKFPGAQLIHQDIFTSEKEIEEKALSIAKNDGYLELEEQFIAPEKTVRAFLNSKLLYDAKLSPIDLEFINKLRIGVLKFMGTH